MTDFNIDDISVDFTPEVDNVKAPMKSIIKVIGVGGGGCNAVKHMYNMGIHDVEFIICNTDKQALDSSPIPIKIQLGKEGLGAGAVPEKAREAALESEEEIKAAIEDANMVFVTAGMGGGTGTGASPIVASIAREMGILTVGIVTFPFEFERDEKFVTAQKGIEELHQNVDALIVIKNETLKTFYPDLKLSQAFAKADDVLLIAAKSIAELITVEAIINVGYRDVDTILRNSGTAIIGSGSASGEDRALQAVQQAIESPLLDNNSIYGAEKMLLFISYSTEYEASVAELDIITQELQNKTCNMNKKFIWGHGVDESLGENIRVTIIATELHNHADTPKQTTTVISDDNDHQPASIIEFDANDGPADNDNKTEEKKNINNDDLRNMSEEEINAYLSMPPYLRNNMNRQKTLNFEQQNEVSDYSVDKEGIKNQPTYLRNVID